MPPLRPCPHCGRHALAEATSCPHCERALAPLGAPGMPRSAAALALGLVLASCTKDTSTHGSMYVDYGAGITDADTDTDTDTDSDTDTDADADPTGETGSP